MQEVKKCCGPLHKGGEVAVTEFGKNQSVCKACGREYYKARYAAKGADIKAYNRKYKIDNRAAMTAYNKEWREANPQAQPTYNKKYVSKTDKRLYKNIKKRIYSWLGNQPTDDQLNEFLGCSIQEWMEWLQKRFTPGMGWKNYGKREQRYWEVDHHMPLSKWDKSDPEQIKRALHYTNTKPLWSRDNQSKGAKVPTTPLPLAA